MIVCPYNDAVLKDKSIKHIKYKKHSDLIRLKTLFKYIFNKVK